MKTKKTDISSLKPGSLRYVWRKLLKNKSAVFGLLVIALLMILSLLSPFICRYDYRSMDALHTYATPTADHLLGTDELGRDILSRVLYGARYTFIIGILSTAIAAVLGIAMGAAAGYFGGKVDSILMRFLDIFQSFPMLILAMAFCAVFGTGIDKCILALGISNISGFARLMRANILRIRNMEYVEAATSIGCPTRRIITSHVIPNAISPIIVEIASLLSQNGIFFAIIAGVVLSGILACTMSTSDSQLLAASSSVSHDILTGFFGMKLEEKKLLAISRLSLCVIAVIGVILAWNSDSSVFMIVSFAWAGFGAAFGPVMLLALFWRRSNKWGALLGMICGGAMIFIWKFGVRPMGGAWNIYELLPAFIVAIVVNVVVSLITKAPEKRVTDVYDQVKQM